MCIGAILKIDQQDGALVHIFLSIYVKMMLQSGQKATQKDLIIVFF